MLSSLRFQTVAIIALTILLSQMAGLVFYSFDRRSALELTEAIDRAERAADVSRLLHEVSAVRRDRAVQLSDTRNLRVWMSPAPAVVMAEPTKAESDVHAFLRTQRPEVADQDIAVRFTEEQDSQVTPPPFDPASRAGSPVSALNIPEGVRNVAISIRHDDNEWVNFLGSINRSRTFLQGFFLADVVTAAVGVALIGFWLVRRVTAPLARLAEAAESLGRNLRSPPLQTSGPSEVAAVATAFNRMQQRLTRLIDGRTEFLAAISHDLRTPITQIRLRLEMAPASPERDKNLNALDDLSETVGTFLNYARASHEAEERSRIDLGALVRSICNDLADGGAAVESHCPPGPVISCKRLAIKRAVTNLVENALKYAQEARVSTAKENDWVVISVNDRGPGIPEAQIETVCAPFRRGDSSRSSNADGVGLGLSITQAVAEDHGGELRLANRREGGLRAELRIPV